jgi:hypothetical protein
VPPPPAAAPTPAPRPSPAPPAAAAPSWPGTSANKRLAGAGYRWAFSALTRSTVARAYYDQRRAAGDRHNAALRRLASKLLGQLHHGLNQRIHYDETLAWQQPAP